MMTEFEATFTNINIQKISATLRDIGAIQQYSRFLQKRVVLHLPKGHEIENGWMRVRAEHDKTTLSLKIVQNDSGIEGQKELYLHIDSFESGVELLESLGCQKKAYQESYRELWTINEVEVTIDEWPFLEPYIEVEGKSEENVKAIVKQLGLDYSQAYFGSVDGLYAKKYAVSEDIINNKTPLITFEMENPFIPSNQ